MAKYIKSYSNYILEKKHQSISDGTIFEKDITTIGARDQFSRNQVPIYRSGNFVITTNDNLVSYKKTSEKGWYRNDTGDIWTSDVLKYYEKDEKSSDDKKILIKKDYFDIRDYAYYGSCSELIRVSIDDILRNFPGELFVPTETLYVKDNSVLYTKDSANAAWGEGNYSTETVGLSCSYTSFETEYEHTTTNSCGEEITVKTISLIEDQDITDVEREELENGIPYTRKIEYLTNFSGETGGNIFNVYPQKIDQNGKCSETNFQIELEAFDASDKINFYLIDNPFNINIHSTDVPDGENPLKYFAQGGVDNYVAYIKNDGEDWKIDEDHEYSIEIKSIEYDGITDDKGCTIVCPEPGKYIGHIKLCFKKNNYSFRTEPGLKRNILNEPIEVCCDGALNIENNTASAVVESSVTNECSKYLTVYMFMGNGKDIKYLVNGNEGDVFNIRIRPNKKVIDDYFNNLDLFEKVLLNRNSSPIYTANFELIGENEYGSYTYLKQFTFPTTYGGYNLGSSSENFETYISSLVKIGEFYDEKYTDNLWRSMTHEAIKNFDWTYTRHYTPGEEEPFIEGGNKIKKIIRIYGREFDEVKSYINAIDDFNTVTYDNVNNIPDYFFSDKLEEEGWDVNLINPLNLSEFVKKDDTVSVDINQLFPNKYDEYGNEITTAEAEKMNYFYDSPSTGEQKNRISIYRVFKQDFGDTRVKPYTKANITTVKNTWYSQHHPEIETKTKLEFTLDNDAILPCAINGEVVSGVVGLSATTVTGEDVAKGYHNDCGDIIRLYNDENEYTPSDVNNEFMKRLYINSRDIWRHKGTIEGIEMLLSMFGLRSKNSIFSNEKYFAKSSSESGDSLVLTSAGKEYYKNYDGELYNLYDYDIKEYTMFTTRLEDEWLPEKNMYKYDWINSTKLITYNTKDYRDGKYVPYQGLPVTYVDTYIETTGATTGNTTGDTTGDTENIDVKKVRYIYPYFNNKSIYDGNPYYQMNGGWMQKKPFMFDTNNNIVIEEQNEDKLNKPLFNETVKDIKCVQTLEELFKNRSLISNNGDICQVIDLSGRFAVIDGTVYQLYGENEGELFFYANINNNTLSIGNAYFTDYVIISNPYYDEQKQRIDLTDEYYNNKEIKVYVLTNEDGTYKIDAYSSESTISTFTVFENGKYMEGDNFTNFFRINNIDYYNELSVFGWQQLRDDEYEYYRMNSLYDYREGNNPHTGHMNYDNGHEYLTYFKNIFKYSYDNDLIDYREYNEGDLGYLEDMASFGFKNLIEDDVCDKDYDKYLRIDSKCHYFGKLIENPNNNGTNEIYRKVLVNDLDNDIPLTKIKYGDVNETIGEEGSYDVEVDNNTNQIINTKRMEIEFFIKNKYEYSKEWLEEVKYIDSIILPYLTQMIPSGIIWRVKYTTRNSESYKTEKVDCGEDNS